MIKMKAVWEVVFLFFLAFGVGALTAWTLATPLSYFDLIEGYKANPLEAFTPLAMLWCVTGIEPWHDFYWRSGVSISAFTGAWGGVAFTVVLWCFFYYY